MTTILDRLHLVDEDDTGLITDTGAAARNRANIEAMWKKEKAHHAEGGLRTAPLLPRPQNKNITQEVKENMAVETKPVVPTVPEKSKAQILWRDSAKIAWFMVFEAINK